MKSRSSTSPSVQPNNSSACLFQPVTRCSESQVTMARGAHSIKTRNRCSLILTSACARRRSTTSRDKLRLARQSMPMTTQMMSSMTITTAITALDGLQLPLYNVPNRKPSSEYPAGNMPRCA